MWTEFRQNIEMIRQENKIPEEEFKPVNILSWQQIQEKIFSTFCNFQSHNDELFMLWEHFKQDTFAVHFDENYPFDSLIQLVDNSENVWLFINDDINFKSKFWFYEGLIKPIVFVLEESFVDEVYISSKKYEWLLCINHHNDLFATGLKMPDKLKQIAEALMKQN